MSGLAPLSEPTLRHLTIADLAGLAARDWVNIHFTAAPYLTAMYSMSKITDKYGLEDGEMVVLYFLNNARTWRGHNARMIKAELNRRVKEVTHS